MNRHKHIDTGGTTLSSVRRYTLMISTLKMEDIHFTGLILVAGKGHQLEIGRPASRSILVGIIRTKDRNSKKEKYIWHTHRQTHDINAKKYVNKGFSQHFHVFQACIQSSFTERITYTVNTLSKLINGWAIMSIAHAVQVDCNLHPKKIPQ